MTMFRKSEGLTLIELLITIAVISVVFAIAIPVFSNVLTTAETNADAATASARAAFAAEYGSATLSFDGTKTHAVLNGTTIASIAGDATSAGGDSGSSSWMSTAAGVISSYMLTQSTAGDGTWSAQTPYLTHSMGVYRYSSFMGVEASSGVVGVQAYNIGDIFMFDTMGDPAYERFDLSEANLGRIIFDGEIEFYNVDANGNVVPFN
jgi:prepilin-type N-terminal cleavage/methylation domain-containing protein